MVARRAVRLLVHSGAVFALAGATHLSPSAFADTTTACGGREATMVGTGPKIVGTPGDDVIVTGTSTVVDAGDGNDLICVSPHDERKAITVNAGEGNDSVDTSVAVVDTHTDLGTGTDNYVSALPAWSYVVADGADDHVAGTARTDITLHITGTPSTLEGAYKADSISVWSSQFDVLLNLSKGELDIDGVSAATLDVKFDAAVSAPRVVLAGNEKSNDLHARGCVVRALGRGGRDRLQPRVIGRPDAPHFNCASRTTAMGGPGADEIYGSGDRDELLGNAGDDEIFGRAGADRLDGGAGDDLLRGSSGDDNLIGGRGVDRVDGNGDFDRCVGERKQRCER